MSEMNRHISLFLPGFFSLPVDERKSFHQRGLPFLLGRGERQRGVSSIDWHEGLWQLMGLPETLSQDVPVAALRLLGVGEAVGEGTYCCADPVHVSPNRDHLLLMGNEVLEIEPRQAQLLVAELNRFFADDGLQLIALTPKQWVWHSDSLPALHCCPLGAATGRNVRQCLPQGEGLVAWNRLVTEAQMLLHGSPINTERRSQGELAINSLWLWGMGPSPAIRQGRFSQLYGDDPFVAGLAQVTQAQHRPLAQNATEVIASLGFKDSAMVVIDFHACQQLAPQISDLDRNWLLPLIEGLKRGDYHRLTLELGGGVAITASANGLKRFWRRRGNVASLNMES